MNASTLVVTINPAFLRAKGRLRWVVFYAWHGLGMLLVAVLAAWVARATTASVLWPSARSASRTT
jgi:hypothetical protein